MGAGGRGLAAPLVVLAVVALLGIVVAAVWITEAREGTFLTNGKEIREIKRSAPARTVLWTPAKMLEMAREVGAGGAEDEYEPRVSSDGTTMVFVRRKPGSNADLYSAKWTPGGWTEGEQISAVNTESDELGPELSWDGKSLYFYSDREGGLGGYDIWVSQRGDDGAWGTPVNLGDGVNTAQNEYGPALTPDGKTLYFASNRPRPGEEEPSKDAWRATVRERRDRHDYDLYASEITGGEAGKAVALFALNTGKDEGSPAVSPGGDFLYFSSDRVEGAGGYDLYRVRLSSGRREEIENLGSAVNSKDNELDPALSADGFRLCFSSDRPLEGEAGEHPYRLYASVSREVYVDVDRSAIYSAMAELWSALWPWLALLAAAVLLGLLAVKMLRSEAWRRRFGRLSLLAQCVLVSMLIHAAVASVLAAWKVGSGIIELVEKRDGGGSRVILASSGAAGDVVGQIMSSGSGEDGGLSLPALMSIRAETPTEEMGAPAVRMTIPNAAPIVGELRRDAAAQEAAPEGSVERSVRVEDSATPGIAAPEVRTAEAATKEAGTDGAVRVRGTELSARVEGKADLAVRSNVGLPGLVVQDVPVHVDAAGEAAPKGTEAGAGPVAAQDGGGPHVATPKTAGGTTTQEATSSGASALKPASADVVHGAVADAARATVALPAGTETEKRAATQGVGAVVGGEATPGSSVREASAVDVKVAEGTGANATVELPRGGAGSAVEEKSHETQTGFGSGPRSAAGVSAATGEVASSRLALPAAGAGRGDVRIEAGEAEGVSSVSKERGSVAGTAVHGAEGSEAAEHAGLPSVAKGGDATPEAKLAERGGGGVRTLAALPVGETGGSADRRVAVSLPKDGHGDAAGSLGMAEAPEADTAGKAREGADIGGKVAAGLDGSRGREMPGVRLPDAPLENVAPVETFDQRSPEVRNEMLEKGGGSRETEAAVGRALEWLARHQEEDGRWTGKHFDDRCGACTDPAEFDGDVAMTGMALLCYLGAGHTHVADGPYRDVVGKGLRWLLLREGADGDMRRGETMYGQTVATVAMCEALSMTKDPRLANPTRRAVELVMNVANKPRGGVRREEDTSVIGWMVMTVESARRAGIAVSGQTFQGAARWLDSVSEDGRPGRYAYRRGESPSIAMTAEAMFVQQIVGRERTEPRMIESAEYLLKADPKWEKGAPTYCWYYATLALFEHKGEAWDRWNRALMPQLLENQRRGGGVDGSWDPQDDWSKMGGRIYQTAVCTLCLEVYYRYQRK